jgi:hypothetical protein
VLKWSKKEGIRSIHLTHVCSTGPGCFLTGPRRNIPTYLPTSVAGSNLQVGSYLFFFRSRPLKNPLTRQRSSTFRSQKATFRTRKFQIFALKKPLFWTSLWWSFTGPHHSCHGLSYQLHPTFKTEMSPNNLETEHLKTLRLWSSSALTVNPITLECGWFKYVGPSQPQAR